MLFNVDVQLKGRLLKNPEEVLPIFNKEFAIGLGEATLLAQGAIISLTPTQTGRLQSSISTEVRGNDLNMKGVVGTPTLYALPMETGAAPHFPPARPIILWVQRIQWNFQNIKQTLSINQMAFLVCRSISEKGLEARSMFNNGFENSKDRILNILGKAQEKIVKLLS